MIDAETIAELFAAFGPVHVRRMFGGAGIYSDGVFFAIVDEGVIYLKADDESAPRFAAEGCRQFVYQGKDREIAMSYWRMPERLYDDPEELADWARQACAAAVRSKMKKAPRKSVAKPKSAKRPPPPTPPNSKRGEKGSKVKRPASSGRARIRGRSRK